MKGLSQMREFYINHDGNIDDFVSYLLLLQASDIKLLGVGVIDGDGYVDPAVEACQKLTDRFNLRNDSLEVARSNSRPINSFPNDWRMAAYSFNYLPLLNEHGKPKTKKSNLPAHLDMIDKLEKADQPVTLVMTGPLTDLARALEEKPEIVNKIKELYWMGGSLDGHGNVFTVNADSTQEWNAFWDPDAVKTVFDSSIKINMIGLESSEELPIDDSFRMHLSQLRRYPAFDLAAQGYAMIVSIPTAELFLWDVLTTMCALYPEIATTEEVTASVITEGMAAGKTIRDPNGRPITLVTKANHQLFFEKFDELLKRQ